MATFSIFSFRINKISPYINFKKSLAGFWRPPPDGARGQMPPLPPLATPLVHGEISWPIDYSYFLNSIHFKMPFVIMN